MMAKLIHFKRLFLIAILFFVNSSVFAQIDTGGDVIVKEKKQKKEKILIEKQGTEFFAQWHNAYSFRTLEKNVSPWGKELGEKADEIADWTSSFSFGVRNKLVSNIYLDMGLGYFTNREIYAFESSDSSYMSTNTYRHIGVPLKVAYITPGEISFYASVGIMPKSFLGVKQAVETSSSKFGKTSTNNVIKKGFNNILIDAIGSVGVRADFGEHIGIMLNAEGRRQLTNNYQKQGPFIRKSFNIGFNLGLYYFL